MGKSRIANRAVVQKIRTTNLEIAFEENGSARGETVVLLHGFPHDPRAYDGVVERLSAEGVRTIVPYLRGFGETLFLAGDTPRSGQQAALGHDLVQLLDALNVHQALLAGYDWGGRAACIVSALWPDRVRALVSCMGYNIQNISTSVEPARPDAEYRYWYQYYFHTERGRRGLAQNRRELCHLLWRLWSPTWAFDQATFDATASSFDNPDFVDVVVHSYRHRFGYAVGDPAFDEIEAELAKQPKITVPTIVLHGADDGVAIASESARHARYFDGPYERRVLPNVGHNVPQEVPDSFAEAILTLL